MMKKQTAVEWLVEQIKNNVHYTVEEFELKVEHAKEMEKRQIMDAYDDGYDLNNSLVNYKGEQYYNETFNSEKL